MRIGKRFEVLGKQVATWILSKWLGGAKQDLSYPLKEPIHTILFVRPNFRMGNLLLVTPALSAARKQIPNAKIGLLTTSAYSHMLGFPEKVV